MGVLEAGPGPGPLAAQCTAPFVRQLWDGHYVCVYLWEVNWTTSSNLGLFISKIASAFHRNSRRACQWGL